MHIVYIYIYIYIYVYYSGSAWAGAASDAGAAASSAGGVACHELKFEAVCLCGLRTVQGSGFRV